MTAGHAVVLDTDSSSVVATCDCGWEWSDFGPVLWSDLSSAITEHQSEVGVGPSGRTRSGRPTYDGIRPPQ